MEQTLSSTQQSCFLAFLHLFQDEASVLHLARQNIFAQRFLAKSLPFIKDIGSAIGLVVNVTPQQHDLSTEYLCSVSEVNNSECLTKAKRDELIFKFEQSLNQANMYDYHKIADNIFSQCVESFTRRFPEELQKLHQVKWEPNAISGEDILVKLETGFGSGGLMINYPDPNIFTESHINHCASLPPRGLAAVFRDQAHQCFNWMPHEFLHCVDTVTRHAYDKNREAQTALPDHHNTMEGYWQAEHIPSTSQLILLALIAKDNPLMFGYPGWFEEAALWFLDFVLHLHKQFVACDRKDLVDDYKIFRHKSLSAPTKRQPFDVCEETTTEYDYLLGRLALESLPPDLDQVEDKLCQITKSMISDGTRSSWLVDSLCVDPDLTDLELLNQPPTEHNKDIYGFDWSKFCS